MDASFRFVESDHFWLLPIAIWASITVDAVRTHDTFLAVVSAFAAGALADRWLRDVRRHRA